MNGIQQRYTSLGFFGFAWLVVKGVILYLAAIMVLRRLLVALSTKLLANAEKREQTDGTEVKWHNRKTKGLSYQFALVDGQVAILLNEEQHLFSSAKEADEFIAQQVNKDSSPTERDAKGRFVKRS